MQLNRREWLASGLAAASTTALTGCAEPTPTGAEPLRPVVSGGSIDWEAVRSRFPRALNETYFNCAAQHPTGAHTVRGFQRYIDFMHNGPGEGREDFWETGYRDMKPMFARLINAKPEEIAFCAGTTVGENLIVNGMDLRGGNVVTNDLHYSASLANYLTRREKFGLDVRIVKHRDWRIDIADMEKAVNKNTKLISVSFVSSVNGHVEDLKKLSDLAHSHGAYLFADIIQGCGATPIDVQAMGIDFAACGTYKWLQGEHGFGFLYVKQDLQGTAVKGTEFTGHPDLNYKPWTDSPDPAKPEFISHPNHGIAEFECSTPAVINYAGQHESFRFIEELGIDNIRAHAREITARLEKELPPLGFTAITPAGSESGIRAFLHPNTEQVRAKIERANKEGRAKISITGPNSALTVGRGGNQVRFSVSVYNNQQDVDKVLEVLS
ncbi:MAG: aminotransferase class V-fold PLP-dependent enzyme [Acidobacteria bacterium]|nr:aminotransferase class V-fold PLP-dependent enzyme [Acidobacteriota bacterium]